MAVQGTTLPRELPALWQRQFVELLRPQLAYVQFSTARPIGRNSGTSILRLPDLADYTGEESSSTRQAETTLAVPELTTVRTTVDIPSFSYRKKETIYRETALETIHNIVPAKLERLAFYAAKQNNILCKTEYNANTNVLYAGAVTDRASVAAGPSANDFRMLRLGFTSVDVPMITQVLRTDASTDIFNVQSSYVGITSEQGAERIGRLAGFVPVHQYATIGSLYAGEVGAIEGFRIIATNLADVYADAGASSADVYTMIAIGQGSMVETYIEGEKDRIIVKGFGENGDDVANLALNIAWATKVGYGVPDERRVWRYEFTGA